MGGAVIEQRYRRTWFPDEQIAPDLVLAALQARRHLAVTDAEVIPWMSVADIGLALGVVKDTRWSAPSTVLDDLLTPNPKVCHRSLPHGLRFRHPVAMRDVRAALNHYEAAGTIVRLPHPLATWGVEFWPLNEADRAEIVGAWQRMDEAREDARHAVKKHRLTVGRLAAGGGQ